MSTLWLNRSLQACVRRGERRWAEDGTLISHPTSGPVEFRFISRKNLVQRGAIFRKPLFIDKPMAASLTEAMEIFRLAKEKNVPCFSSSSLRFGSELPAVRSGESRTRGHAVEKWSC